ncbi:MAG: Rod shape-determining protein MreD [Thermonemataceae bacterium]
MNQQGIFPQLLGFIGYIVFQVFFARKMILFETAFCFTYVGFLLGLPYRANRIYLLLIAFLTGLIIDAFYDTLGIHIAACLLLAYVRPFVVNTLVVRSNVNRDLITEVSVRELGSSLFATYATLLIFIHHSIIFFIEAGTIQLLAFSLKRVIFSTIFTLITVIIVQYLFLTPKRR